MFRPVYQVAAPERSLPSPTASLVWDLQGPIDVLPRWSLLVLGTGHAS